MENVYVGNDAKMGKKWSFYRPIFDCFSLIALQKKIPLYKVLKMLIGEPRYNLKCPKNDSIESDVFGIFGYLVIAAL